ncbi:MAG: hypothetical protein EOO06_04960 [Chitinophagaceae bacterium]|nr:MAG: hypothetical protein EOO06_04960 [Chitinophagaceae bacterium]
MKFIPIFAMVCLLISCQKDPQDPNLPERTTQDSIIGEWKYTHEYRLVATQAAPNVIIDSVYSDNYAPLSYFKVMADSSFKWWRTSMETAPAVGYGVSGKVTVNANLRTLKWSESAETTNDFATQTVVSPVRYSPDYSIKLLTNTTLVCSYRVVGPDGNFWYWHDVYTK